MKHFTIVIIFATLLFSSTSCDFFKKKDNTETPEQKAAAKSLGLDDNPRNNGTQNNNYNRRNQNNNNQNGYNDQNTQSNTDPYSNQGNSNNGYNNQNNNGYNQNNNNQSSQSNYNSTQSSTSTAVDIPARAYTDGCNAFKAGNYSYAATQFIAAINEFKQLNIVSELSITAYYFLAVAQSNLNQKDYACTNLQSFEQLYNAYPDQRTALVQSAYLKVRQLRQAHCQ